MHAEALVKEGRLDEAVTALAAQIRAKPQDAKLRIFLFQLSAVMGQWDRALDQLDIAAQMDPAAKLMSQVCRPAIQCERMRQSVFAGERTPLVIGQPEEWLAHLIQAAMLSGQGKEDAAAELRTRALDAAPTTSGTIERAQPKGVDDRTWAESGGGSSGGGAGGGAGGGGGGGGGEAFAWISDADVRLGPVLEAVIEGKYYWIPFQNLLMIEIDPPTDLRDVVWAPARLILAAGGEKVALIPTRYPGSEAASNPAAVRLARTMQFGGADGETPLGLRVLNTDQSEYALFDIARVKLGDPAALKAALAAVQAQRAEEMQAKLIASGALKTGLPGMTADGGAGAGGGGVGGGHG